MSQNQQHLKNRAKLDKCWEKTLLLYGDALEQRSIDIRSAYSLVTRMESGVGALRERGLLNGEIASLFSVNVSTTDYQTYRLRSKLGLKRSDNLLKMLRKFCPPPTDEF